MKHLLLLHGAIGSKDQFLPIANELKEHFIIHTLNFRGHGGNPMPEKFSIDIFANDVLQYLDDNNIERINIFGYSMGGYVALYLAKMYPEKVDRIFTLATKFLWTPEIAEKEMKMLDAEKIRLKVPAFASELERRHAPERWEMVLKRTSEMMKEMGSHNPLEISDYNDIAHKTLIGIGDKDSMVSLEETINVYRHLQNSNLIVLPNTSHPLEKADISRLKNEIIHFF